MKVTVRLLSFLLAVLLLVPSLFSCGDRDGREKIAVTILPQVELVSAVAGEDFHVVALVPPGYSPEGYEPTVRAMADFSESLLYFSIGIPMEATSLLPSLSDTTRHVSLADGVRAVYPDLSIHGGRDPHIWLSPKRVKHMVGMIADELSSLRPERAALYRENAEAYCAALDRADAEIREMLAECERKEFIAYHPAFAYFAEEYGLTMHAVEAHGSEVSPMDRATIESLARERGIKVIFYQEETGARQASSIAEAIGGRAVMLSPLSGDYLQNLKNMAREIAAAMESEAP